MYNKIVGRCLTIQYNINFSNNSNRAKGANKEMHAAQYLANQGYTILDINYQCHIGEIDIIAQDGDTLVFVEVKYRKDVSAGCPEEAVTFAKQKKISKVALYYLATELHRTDIDSRFDVIAIQGEDVRHYENAFNYN